MTEKKKRLKLNRETLRDLTTDDLKSVVGGRRPTNANPCETYLDDPSERTCTIIPSVLPCEVFPDESLDC